MPISSEMLRACTFRHRTRCSAPGNWCFLLQLRVFQAPVARKMQQVDVIEIDLTSDDDDARSRIMAHASRVLAQRGQPRHEYEPSPAHRPILAQQAQEDYENQGGAAHHGDSIAKRQKTDCTLHDGANAGFSGQLLYPMNDVLKALHQERSARHQRHDQAAQDTAGGARGPAKRKAHERHEQPGNQSQQAAMTQHMLTAHAARPAAIKLLTYNIWFDENVALRERMQGLVDIVNQTQPDVLMLQEVTQNMMLCWQSDNPKLLQDYTFSRPPANTAYYTLIAFKTSKMQPVLPMRRDPFPGTKMGRDVLSVPLSVSAHPNTPPLLVATSHLESPCGRENLYVESRELQLEVGTEVLSTRAQNAMAELPRRLGSGGQQQQPAVDIVWGGDMNWIHNHKGEPRLPVGWQDVWSEARPLDKGTTWDARTNAMLKGCTLKPGRLDRFFARLTQWQVESVELVGTQPLPDVTATRNGKTTPVLVSDHYGVLLQLRCP